MYSCSLISWLLTFLASFTCVKISQNHSYAFSKLVFLLFLFIQTSFTSRMACAQHRWSNIPNSSQNTLYVDHPSLPRTPLKFLPNIFSTISPPLFLLKTNKAIDNEKNPHNHPGKPFLLAEVSSPLTAFSCLIAFSNFSYSGLAFSATLVQRSIAVGVVMPMSNTFVNIDAILSYMTRPSKRR